MSKKGALNTRKFSGVCTILSIISESVHQREYHVLFVQKTFSRISDTDQYVKKDEYVHSEKGKKKENKYSALEQLFSFSL